MCSVTAAIPKSMVMECMFEVGVCCAHCGIKDVLTFGGFWGTTDVLHYVVLSAVLTDVFMVCTSYAREDMTIVTSTTTASLHSLSILLLADCPIIYCYCNSS